MYGYARDPEDNQWRVVPYYRTTSTYTMNNAAVSESFMELIDRWESSTPKKPVSKPKKPVSKPPDDEGKEMFTDDELNELLET